MKFLLPILLYLSVLVASLQAATEDDLTFTLINDGTEYSVSDCLETASGTIEIPSTYNGLPVTSIGSYAFYNCTSLNSIIIPDSVTSIGAYAFQSCTSLESITIPNSITSMKDSIFRFCSSLTNITIPETLTSIEDSAFSGCSSLTSITIPDSVASIGGWAFFQCDSLTSLTYEGDAPTFGNNQFFGNDTTIYYYNDATGFSTPTFQGRPSQMLIRGNQQFQIIEGDFTWHEAKADAEARGGRLAVLNTQEKIDAANEYLLSLGTWNNSWIGLTDEVSESEWKWINGLVLGTEDWAEQNPEPNGGATENYAAIRGSDSSGWADVEGNLALSYLLEIVAPEPLSPVLSVDTFYESNSGESITIDASPTDGYPTNYTYQWSFKGVNSSNYFIIPSNFGGTASNYQISGNSGNNGTWKVEVTNDTGATTAEFNYRVYADSDSDGLSDGREEFILGTDPNDNDSDDDTLLDGVETNTGAWVSASDTGTDPLSDDTDNDGLIDGIETNTAEYVDASDTGTDPNNSDTDGDSLLDGVESNTGTYVDNSDTGTDPLEVDSDGDSIEDGYETATGSWTSNEDTGTNPTKADSDADGIIDGRETNTGAFIGLSDTGTDPHNQDSDGDGFSDQFEVNTSYDPTSASDTPDALTVIRTAVEVDIYAADGGVYRVEYTEDLDSDIWITVEDGIIGNGEIIYRLYSAREYPRRFFRAIRTDQ